MNVKTESIFAVTSIVDRSGRRVGSYLVDRSKEDQNRDKKQHKNDKESTDREDQAAVFHASETLAMDKTRPAKPTESTDPHPLDLTV
jgi:hypothetical protein